MKHLLEKVSLLALSAMLISTYSISAAIPYMLEVYPGQSVELLISLPSFTIMAVLLGNRWLSHYLSEHQMIVLGLLCIGGFGMAPFWVQTYPFLVFSRLLLGLGVGLINAKAISIISEHFEGEERIQMLGYRGSAEVVGSSFLTLLVGVFLTIDWTWAFLIYGFAFLVLVLYLLFVPRVAEQEEEGELIHLSASQRGKASLYGLLAGLTVFVNTVVSMRLPVMVTGMGLGTASQAGYVLSFQQLIGIASGLLFSLMLRWFGFRLGGLAYLGLGGTFLLMGSSHHFALLALGAIASGFFYSVSLTGIFYRIADRTPASLINAATAIVLLGCNLGSAFSPYLLKGLGVFLTSNSQIFLLLGGLLLALGAGWCLLARPAAGKKE